MATLKAPFNFVPLNEEPYIPSWGETISQDIPFRDALSGSIVLRIQSESPIFISDTDAKTEKGIHEFCHTKDGHYFIPATSIKGALRNVMEILSYGKMTQVQEQSFGIRDLSNGADGRFYRKKVNVDNVMCGFMKYEDGKYFLRNCGKPWRISPERIDEKFGTKLTDFIRKSDFSNDENKTAKKKYELLNIQGICDEDLKGFFKNDPEFNNNESFNAGGRIIKCFNDNGNKGTIVFTGQPGPRKGNNGKFFEFIFPDNISDYVEVPKSVMKIFVSIHTDSPDYKDFRKSQLREGKEIPVFFTMDKKGNIESIGLSYMFKYPAYNSIYNGIPLRLLNDKPDLCECIFGYTSRNDSLKGRVQFTTAFLQGTPDFYPDQVIALAKPHPSYYPLYLGNGQTWNSPQIQIAGRKRYPIRNRIESNAGTEGMTRTIRPLNKGSVFISKVYFHNLRPVELGAIVASIRYLRYHSLGQGKPLGYGKVTINIQDSEILNNNSFNLNHAREAFEKEMESNFSGWINSQQLAELKIMSEGIPSDKDNFFIYLKMDMDSDRNEFKKGKTIYNNGYQLGTFTQIISDTVPRTKTPQNVSPDATRKDIEKELEERRQREFNELLLKKKRQEEVLRNQEYESLIANANHLYLENLIEEAIIEAEKAKSILPNDSRHEEIIRKCKSAIASNDFNKIESEKKANQLRQPYLDVLKGKTSIGNIIGTTKKWKEANNVVFGDSEFIVLMDSIKSLPPKELKKNRGRIKELYSLIGDDYTNKLLEELNI